MGDKKKRGKKKKGKKSKQPAGCQNPNIGEVDEQSKVMSSLTEQTGLIAINEEDDDSAYSIYDLTDDDASCSNSVISISKRMYGKSRKGDKVIAATGMGSDISGKISPDLTSIEPTSELSKSRQHPNSNKQVSDVLEESCGLTGGASYIASSSNNESSMPKKSFIDVLVGTGTKDDKGKSPLHEPHVWKKALPQGHLPLPGDDFGNYRRKAYELEEKTSFLHQQAAILSARGDRGRAKTLRDEAKTCRAMSQQEHERASKILFDLRNKGFNNWIELDLHDQLVEEGINFLKEHIEFAVRCRTLRYLRVITGYGSHGTGPSKLKEEIVNLLDTEKIQWEEEEGNPGCLIITFGGRCSN